MLAAISLISAPVLDTTFKGVSDKRYEAFNFSKNSEKTYRCISATTDESEISYGNDELTLQ